MLISWTQLLKTWAKVILLDKDGVMLKTAIYYQRLKIWLDSEGGKHVPQKKVLCIIMTI